MRASRTIIATMTLAALLLVSVAVVSAAGGRTFSTTLTGEAEVPGPGDPDGSGTATVTVNPGTGEVCYTLTVEDVATITAAHIHIGVAGEAGPVFIPLTNLPTDGSSSGCETVSRTDALAIITNPSNYYVNVHNAEFPDGALRGQLSR
jgi:hypothetical protein